MAETVFLIFATIVLAILFTLGERDGRNVWEEFERKKRRKKLKKREVDDED